MEIDIDRLRFMSTRMPTSCVCVGIIGFGYGARDGRTSSPRVCNRQPRAIKVDTWAIHETRVMALPFGHTCVECLSHLAPIGGGGQGGRRWKVGDRIAD
ncbi:hypothetical protein M404DRAFT_187107 [Pisolithus tinctorius Marx 270]|uniref:Uncharacterized protein n=1 Tax=Pisolithus tinctorius Marx 270 TaxID=870435 RepID=A0A0C3KZ47_PISTI|nr:hypothetical protein M404DRAFT_187107 [Pisolithus tinctorius Marx 270]